MKKKQEIVCVCLFLHKDYCDVVFFFSLIRKISFVEDGVQAAYPRVTYGVTSLHKSLPFLITAHHSEYMTH